MRYIMRARKRDLLRYIDDMERRLKTMDSYYRLLVYLDSFYPIQNHLRRRAPKRHKHLIASGGWGDSPPTHEQ
jgi:hypothetical protein